MTVALAVAAAVVVAADRPELAGVPPMTRSLPAFTDDSVISLLLVPPTVA